MACTWQQQTFRAFVLRWRSYCTCQPIFARTCSVCERKIHIPVGPDEAGVHSLVGLLQEHMEFWIAVKRAADDSHPYKQNWQAETCLYGGFRVPALLKPRCSRRDCVFKIIAPYIPRQLSAKVACLCNKLGENFLFFRS